MFLIVKQYKRIAQLFPEMIFSWSPSGAECMNDVKPKPNLNFKSTIKIKMDFLIKIKKDFKSNPNLFSFNFIIKMYRPSISVFSIISK